MGTFVRYNSDYDYRLSRIPKDLRVFIFQNKNQKIIFECALGLLKFA